MSVFVKSPNGKLIPKTSLNAAINDDDSAGFTIVITGLVSTGTAEIPATRSLQVLPGGMLQVNPGCTLTISCFVDAGLYQIFTGLGVVRGDFKTNSHLVPQWWGARGDNINNDGPAIKAMIVATKGTAEAGCRTYYFTKGIYRVEESITLTDLYGSTWVGDGGHSSYIRYMPTDSELFYITGYLGNTFRDICFQGEGASNVCFRFKGVGGGTETLFESCVFYGFNRVFTTVDTDINDDTLTCNSCYFRYSNTIWYNTNPQAVIWAFNDCQTLYSKGTLFWNPGGNLRVIGGSWINYNTLCYVSLTNMGYEMIFKDMKFEPLTEVAHPENNVKFLVNEGNGSSGALFENCIVNGGNDNLNEKDIFNLSGLFTLAFRRCSFGGHMVLQVNQITNNKGPEITFDNCPSTPLIHQTTFAANDYLGANIRYINSQCTTSAEDANLTGTLSRRFTASPISNEIIPGKQKIFVGNITIGTAPYGQTIHVPVPPTGVRKGWTISAVDFYYYDNTTATALITLYTDAGKGTKVYEFSKGASASEHYDSVALKDLITKHTLKFEDAPMYLEIVPTGNVEMPRMSMILTLTDFL